MTVFKYLAVKTLIGFESKTYFSAPKFFEVKSVEEIYKYLLIIVNYMNFADTLNTLLIILLFLVSGSSGDLTFNNPTYLAPQTFNITQAPNGILLQSDEEGWIASDILSTTNFTTFYVTILNLTESAAAIGPTEVADTYCTTSAYPLIWTNFVQNIPGEYSCYSDFLTMYTQTPPNSQSVTSTSLFVGHLFRYDIFPDLNAGCYSLTITGKE